MPGKSRFSTFSKTNRFLPLGRTFLPLQIVKKTLIHGLQFLVDFLRKKKFLLGPTYRGQVTRSLAPAAKPRVLCPFEEENVIVYIDDKD